ncbi:hypothetical protein ACO0K2_04380 [Undibacterium sp. MH2W]|uniref:hypothetical protein n=1 Tax=Undibacterium sp. MH2W TaxID=3413044 RepID=UPI003BF155C5
MANNFQITISAIDRATAVVRKINKSMDRLTKPIIRIRQSLGALGREIGLDKVGRSIGNVGRSASVVTSKLSSMLGPLSIIVGGGTVAGIASLATEWARFGSEVSNSSALIGISVDSLQSLRGAASVVGVGAQELTGGLKSLGDTMEDALFGRNQQALVVLNRLGVGIHKTKDGSIDAARGFRDLSVAISGIKNAQVQGVIARTFGLEATLPLLRKGPKAIEEYEQKVAALGGVMNGPAIEAAQKFGVSLDYLSIAAQATKNSIGEKLVPILQPLIEQFTSWTAANRDLIATKVAQFVEGLAHWLNELDFKKIGDDLRALAKNVDDVVESIGGWKNAAIGVVVLMNGSLIASVVNLGLAIGGLATTAIPAAIRTLGLLGTALSAMPIGWVIAGIGAIAVGVYAIYRNWDGISEYFGKKLAGVKAAFDKSWTGGILKALWEFSPVKIVGDEMNALSKWLFDFDLYDAGEKLIGSLASGMKSVLSLFPNSALRAMGLDSWVSGRGSAVQTSAQSGDARGIRNNNPGNLRSWGNMPKDSGGYAVFPTKEAGLSATIQNLQAQQKLHGLNTIRGIISRWAPSNENDTQAYISDMVKRTGFGADQQLNLNDSRTVAPLISGIVKHEGNGSGFSDDMINRAVSAQLGGGGMPGQQASPQKMEVALTLHGLPSGVSATAKTASGTAMPVRVAYTMPTGITP